MQASRLHYAAGQHANPVSRIHIFALMEDGLLVADAIAVGVFEDQDAIPFLPLAETMPIVHHLANPDSAEMVDVDAGRIEHRRLRVFAGEQRRFESLGDIQPFDRILRVAATNTGWLTSTATP